MNGDRMLSRFRSQMSPAALVISLIALFVAIGGVAGALPGKNTVNSGDVKKNTLKGADINESTLNIPTAALPAGAGSTIGVTVSNSGVVETTTLPGVTVTPGGSGLFTVTFPRSLDGCVPVASDQAPSPSTTAIRAQVVSNNRVFIGSGDLANNAFSLIVNCPN